MLNLIDVLENIGKNRKISLDLNTRDPSEITQFISYIRANLRDNSVRTSLAKYGRIYLETESESAMKEFMTSLFNNGKSHLLRLQNIRVEESQSHIPEDVELPYETCTIPPAEIIRRIENCLSKFSQGDQSNRDGCVKVAVIDTGIDYSHVCLQQNINVENPGKNFVQEFKSGVKPLPENKPLDQMGHGTHIAGIIVQEMPHAQIYSLKVLDHLGKGDGPQLIEALDWCRENPFDIINLSIGRYQHDPLCQEIILSQNPRTVFVAAAGNHNFGASYPSSYNNVISVGSVDDQSKHSAFSNVWRTVDVSARGENVPSTFPYNNYAVLSGTSMAAPLITSILASGLYLLKRNIRSWNARDLEITLKDSVRQASLESLESIQNQYGLSSIDEAYQWAYGAGIVDKDLFMRNIRERF